MFFAVRYKIAQLFPSPKRWPKGGQNWDIKEKRFCIFAHLELLAKSFWCPEQERLNYFLLSINSCCFGLYELLYTQITHQNPVKRKKYGQTMAKGFQII